MSGALGQSPVGPHKLVSQGQSTTHDNGNMKNNNERGNNLLAELAECSDMHLYQ